MLRGIAILLCFQAAGEAVSTLAGHMVSGPILGLIFLFGYLTWQGEVEASLEMVSDGLLSNMAILFVPGGVGVILYGDIFRDNVFTITLALVLGSFATLAVTALVAEMMVENWAGVPDWTELNARGRAAMNAAQTSLSASIKALPSRLETQPRRYVQEPWTTELGALRTPSYAIAVFHPED